MGREEGKLFAPSGENKRMRRWSVRWWWSAAREGWCWRVRSQVMASVAGRHRWQDRRGSVVLYGTSSCDAGYGPVVWLLRAQPNGDRSSCRCLGEVQPAGGGMARGGGARGWLSEVHDGHMRVTDRLAMWVLGDGRMWAARCYLSMVPRWGVLRMGQAW